MKDYCSRETAEALKRLGLDQKGYQRYWVERTDGEYSCLTLDNDMCYGNTFAAPSAGEALDKLPLLIEGHTRSIFGLRDGRWAVAYGLTKFHVIHECLAEAACLLLIKLMEEAIL